MTVIHSSTSSNDKDNISMQIMLKQVFFERYRYIVYDTVLVIIRVKCNWYEIDTDRFENLNDEHGNRLY